MDPIESSPRKVRLLTAVVLVATFAAGTLTGTGLCRWIAAGYGPPLPPAPPFAPLPLAELGLSEEQRAAAGRIVDQHRAELEAILRDTYPKVRAIHERIEQEIREVLTPEQRVRLDGILASRPPPLPPVPPPEAFSACQGLAAGAACTVPGPAGALAGACHPGPPPGGALVCVPSQMPPPGPAPFGLPPGPPPFEPPPTPPSASGRPVAPAPSSSAPSR